MQSFNLKNLVWHKGQLNHNYDNHSIKVITRAHTDLWQRTYYHFQNDNTPMLLMQISEKYFSFEVKVNFAYKKRFDQCGIILYQDSQNWVKASIEYENQEFNHLGCVVTNLGYSDWSTIEVNSNINTMYYRLSRRDDDFCVQYSFDGIKYSQMRIFHMFNVKDSVNIGIYACSPNESSFEAIFSDFTLKECMWEAHKE